MQASRSSSESSLRSMTNFWDPAVYEVRRRSAQLMMDPKARELNHFVGSKRHEARLRDAAGLGMEDATEARAAAEVLKEISAVEDHTERFDPTARCQARLEWRQEMDRGIRRLMQDADLMLDDRMSDTSKHGLRCEHLDKTYAWFKRHGKKEASKERDAPPYLRFEIGAPVMPGSMRRDSVHPKGWMPAPTKGAASTTSSGTSRGTLSVSPSIMAAAAQTVGTGSSASGLGSAAAAYPGNASATPLAGPPQAPASGPLVGDEDASPWRPGTGGLKWTPNF